MDFEVAWTEQAASDLESVYTFIAEHSPTAAQRTIRDIRAKANLLATVPFMGAHYLDTAAGSVRAVLSGKHRIYYRVKESDSRVEIITVRHTARRPLDASDFEP